MSVLLEASGESSSDPPEVDGDEQALLGPQVTTITEPEGTDQRTDPPTAETADQPEEENHAPDAVPQNGGTRYIDWMKASAILAIVLVLFFPSISFVLALVNTCRAPRRSRYWWLGLGTMVVAVISFVVSTLFLAEIIRRAVTGEL
eukprot:m.31200 g.31200  ORF g.31200 m.31200 type:complete len:146 (+) comp41652_c0_seq1:29-466(+)